MRGKAITYSDFRGGVNTDAAPYNLNPNETRNARNVQATTRGAIRKRDGSQQFAETEWPLTSLSAFTAPRFIIGSNGFNIYSISPGGVRTQIAGAQAAGSYWEWISAPPITGQGPFFGVNGSAALTWTGAGSTATWTGTVGTVPVGRYIKYHGTRVWIAGTTANPSRLQWSNIGDPRDWPPSNVVDFDPFDGEEITGLGTAGPYLLVFKPSKIWLVTDLDTGANRLISRNIGCIAPRSIVETPEGTLFLTPDQGVMVANHNNTQLLSNNQRVSDAILPTIRDLPAAALRLAAGAYHDQHYYLAVSQEGIRNDLLLDYDMQLRSWWMHTHRIAAMVVWEATTDQPELFGQSSEYARLDRLFVPNVTTDHWGAFPAYWESPFLTFGKPQVRKRCRQIHFDGEGRIQVSIAKDFEQYTVLAGEADFGSDAATFGGDGLFAGDGVFGGETLVGEASVYTPGVARAWSVAFGNLSSESFVVDSFSMMMQERTD